MFTNRVEPAVSNLAIGPAMHVAQRGEAATSSQGMQMTDLMAGIAVRVRMRWFPVAAECQ